MKQRIISAFVGLVLLVLVMLCGEHVFNISVALISAIAIYEIIGALGLNKKCLMTGVAILLPAALTVVTYFNRELICPVVFLFVALFMIIMLFNHEKYAYNDVSKYIACSVMVAMSFIHLSFVRNMDNGIVCVFIIFIGSWITDTCAYFTGIAFGKHKLAPKISPKKTIEGSIGGIIGVTLIIIAYTFICANKLNVSVNVVPVIIIGLLSGILSQFGDLCASIIKRENNVKDFGSIMPGHGGVMDRFDSFLFVAPAIYYILEYLPVFS